MKEWILFIPEGSCKCSSRMGSNCFYLCFIELVLMKGTWPFYFRCGNRPFWNLENVLSPEGRCECSSRMGSNFFYLYFIELVLMKGTWYFCFRGGYRPFWNLENVLSCGWVDGWMGGWMDGWVGALWFFCPFNFPYFKYDNKQYELIPKLCLKIALAF